jgi:Restriction endonuclease S subunits
MLKDPKTFLVPKLRFPEFRNEPPWVTRKLGELFRQREETGRDDLRLLSLTDKEGIIPQEESNRKNNASVDRSKYLRVARGDIVYNTMRMWEGRSALATLEGIVSPAYTVCEPCEETNSLFFAHYFKTSQLVAQFARYSQGLVKDTLNLKFEAFARILAPTPSPAEQQKIAECLSTLDELIEAESRKLNALKDHKKGLMQQLFPREGETRPRLRFPEFQDAPEWESKTVDDLVDTITPPKKLLTSDYRPAGQFPVIDQSQDYICGWTDDEEAVIDDDLPVVVFGDHTCALKFVDRPFAQGADGIKILKAKADVRDDFLFYSLQANPVQQESYKRHFSTLRERVVAFPDKDSGEQRRIAACVSSLDDLIAAQSERLEALRAHKRGLMQQLFPNPSEFES